MVLSNHTRKIIIDTKYYEDPIPINNYGQKKFISENLFQIFSYMKNTGITEHQNLEGILLYAAVDEDFDHQYRKDGNKISVKSINLNQDFEGIKTDLKRVIA